ncbi:hypothetical protein I316_04661 [Kwoniella heveanensis BCC8398]|uniref:Uncharacterized protein n=1 Tax=Kwoniella heveanensis BCC8398 TaxID=1296120 RepID=A0A1B9GRI9_9TREE|nr:hypothetical protein I316_04661 [Kwoniella heveanensis BCC8398]
MSALALADERVSSAALSDEDEDMDELELSYEQERIANIRERDDLLAQLGLNKPSNRISGGITKKPTFSAEELRRKRELRALDAQRKKAFEPIRRSGRLAARENEPKAYPDGSDAGTSSPSPNSRSSRLRSPPAKPLIPKATAPTLAPGPSYSPSASGPSSPAPRPTRGDDGRLIFEGRWQGVFTPNLTPEDMFAGGAFGGGFFADTYSNILKSPMSASDDIATLSFTLPNARKLLTNPIPDGENNRFRVRAGQSLQEWEKAGWIWGQDPRGWAQWYVRFWEGRRCEDDERQVRRWLKVAGPTGRFKRALLKKLVQSGGQSALADEDIGAVLRQCLWQWGYEMTEVEFERAMNGE